MAKVKSLQSSEESKAKKAAEDLRFKNTTEKQKKFLKENPNAKTMDEMEKKIADAKSRTQSVSRMNPVAFKKGGKVKGCKMAKRGKGRAYGKNS